MFKDRVAGIGFIGCALGVEEGGGSSDALEADLVFALRASPAIMADRDVTSFDAAGFVDKMMLNEAGIAAFLARWW